MLEILNSSILGNIIGIVSLIVSGLTFRKTKLVSSQIKKLKTETMLEMRFGDYQTQALKILEIKLNAIKDTSYISYDLLCELLQLTRTLCDLAPASLNPRSKKIIFNAYKYIKTIMKTPYSLKKEEQTQLFDYLVQLINILKKGE